MGPLQTLMNRRKDRRRIQSRTILMKSEDMTNKYYFSSVKKWQVGGHITKTLWRRGHITSHVSSYSKLYTSPVPDEWKEEVCAKLLSYICPMYSYCDYPRSWMKIHLHNSHSLTQTYSLGYTYEYFTDKCPPQRGCITPGVQMNSSESLFDSLLTSLSNSFGAFRQTPKAVW